ncbi:PepSY domain-containing protein [Algimonas porphyrae]|uniref:PepSY-associated TM helix domain-containing protein n=1 Tax=Algimonas porphyrae TaxID=1128113 RepID=UPI0024E1184E|nr:PepSY-associated TM helix domain-containing protein [Algimonas porphyrae]
MSFKHRLRTFHVVLGGWLSLILFFVVCAGVASVFEDDLYVWERPTHRVDYVQPVTASVLLSVMMGDDKEEALFIPPRTDRPVWTVRVGDGEAQYVSPSGRLLPSYPTVGPVRYIRNLHTDLGLSGDLGRILLGLIGLLAVLLLIVGSLLPKVWSRVRRDSKKRPAKYRRWDLHRRLGRIVFLPAIFVIGTGTIMVLEQVREALSASAPVSHSSLQAPEFMSPGLDAALRDASELVGPGIVRSVRVKPDSDTSVLAIVEYREKAGPLRRDIEIVYDIVLGKRISVYGGGGDMLTRMAVASAPLHYGQSYGFITKLPTLGVGLLLACLCALGAVMSFERYWPDRGRRFALAFLIATPAAMVSLLVLAPFLMEASLSEGAYPWLFLFMSAVTGGVAWCSRRLALISLATLIVGATAAEMLLHPGLRIVWPANLAFGLTGLGLLCLALRYKTAYLGRLTWQAKMENRRLF